MHIVKHSGSLAVVVLQQPTEPVATSQRAIPYLARRGYKPEHDLTAILGARGAAIR